MDDKRILKVYAPVWTGKIPITLTKDENGVFVARPTNPDDQEAFDEMVEQMIALKDTPENEAMRLKLMRDTPDDT